jgi:hypothetical protein
LQHLAVFGDAILTLRCALETIGIDVLEPDENFFCIPREPTSRRSSGYDSSIDE